MQTTCSAEVEEFNKSFDHNLCLIACMASTTGNDIWYIDNGVFGHMTGHKEFFRSLQEGGVNLHIDLGYDARYQVQGVGIVSFQRDSRKPLSFANILYVPCLMKNLIFVSTKDDKGFEVKFHDKKVYIIPKGLDRSLDWVIGI